MQSFRGFEITDFDLEHPVVAALFLVLLSFFGREKELFCDIILLFAEFQISRKILPLLECVEILKYVVVQPNVRQNNST